MIQGNCESLLIVLLSFLLSFFSSLTSYIINSMESLLKTKSVVCWIKNDIEFKIAEQAPLNSDLHRLLDEKKYLKPVLDMEGELSRHCLLSIKNIGQTINLKDKVLFINELSLYGFSF